MKTTLIFSLPPSTLRIGVLEARNLTIKPSTESYKARIAQDIRSFLDPAYIYPDDKQKGIRSLLKVFGFHPSGRNRPASEFLFKDLQNRGSFNYINNAVDINNHVSLLSNLPISVLDLDKSGYNLSIRLGLENESYIFNREGQELALKKLPVIARQNSDLSAVGSPIKDSQATKVFSETKNLAFFIYTSKTITTDEELHALLNLTATHIETETETQEITSKIFDACP